jgi:hypothetical protein
MNREAFTEFLVEAKKHTYVAEGGEARVPALLNGSKQLEYKSGDFFYRDIYLGSEFFLGQEIVEYKNRPIWSMVYSGGVMGSNAAKDEIVDIYAFLRQALRLVNENYLYRGPDIFQNNKFQYHNQSYGTLDHFHGYEWIERNHQKVYELRYHGGFIR